MNVYVPGTFDLPHVGHMRLLAYAQDRGYSILGLNPDDFVLRYKGRSPLMSLDERIEFWQGCRYVDRVIVNVAGEDSKPAILEANAQFILHGDDWTGDAYMKQLGVTRTWLRANDIEIIHAPYTKGISTTDLIERVRDSA